MKRRIASLLALAGAPTLWLSLWLSLAPAALAQPPEPGAVAVLYDQPNFHGHSVQVVGGEADLKRVAFSHMAMSGHFTGDWVVCDGPKFTGRCVTLMGTVANFIPLGMDRQIVSLRQGEAVVGAGPPPEADDGYYDRGAAPRPEPREAPAPPEQPTPSNEASDSAPTSANASPGADSGVAGYGAVFFANPQVAGAGLQARGRAGVNAFCRAHGLGGALYYDTDGRVVRDVLCRRG